MSLLSNPYLQKVMTHDSKCWPNKNVTWLFCFALHSDGLVLQLLWKPNYVVDWILFYCLDYYNKNSWHIFVTLLKCDDFCQCFLLTICFDSQVSWMRSTMILLNSLEVICYYFIISFLTSCNKSCARKLQDSSDSFCS